MFHSSMRWIPLLVLTTTACRVNVVRKPTQAPAPTPVAVPSATGDVAFLHPFGAPTRPFSPAVRVGNLVFLAGQIGTSSAAAGGGVVPGGVEAETRQTLANIKGTLEAVGLSMDRVVKCTVFMADMKEWDAMNAIYRTYFTAPNYPARSAFGANGLALNARVEIECIAAVR